MSEDMKKEQPNLENVDSTEEKISEQSSMAAEIKTAIEAGDFDVEEFLSQYKAALTEKDEAEAKLLRLQADFDNFRRRAKADNENNIHLALSALVNNLLAVTDNFYRALQAMKDGPDKDGVDMISRQLLDILNNAGLTEIEAEGQPFDPNIHHCVSQTEAKTEDEKGKVLMVLQKGYMLNDRLLRAAMVQVGM